MDSSELFKGETKIDSLRIFSADLNAFINSLKEEKPFDKDVMRNLFLRFKRNEETEAFFEEVYEGFESAYRHLDMNAVFQLHATLVPKWSYSQFNGPTDRGTFFVALTRKEPPRSGAVFTYSSANGNILPRVFTLAVLGAFLADCQSHKQEIIRESMKK